MNQMFISKIAGAAMEGLLFEVSAAPKPGLVDPYCCGAHKDMNYFTFLSSAAALHSCFDEMVGLGIEHSQKPIAGLLQPLRDCGIKYEKAMFDATKGINTHKGMIFTLGILCGCAGWSYGKQALSLENLCDLSMELCNGICAREYAGLDKKKELTKGERIFLEHGFTGVRGEVEGGYQTIRNISMPVYKKLRSQNIPINQVLIQTLLSLIAETNDTNIMARHDVWTSEYAKQSARKAIELGGILTESGTAYIKEMERDFIQRNISPGGCADLLAVTHFLYEIERMNLI